MITEARFTAARHRLGHFVREQAQLLTECYGITYAAVPDAPSDLPSLCRAWAKAERSGVPFPVWSGASENTIYLGPEANHAFRFWHDSLHVLSAGG